MATTDVPALVTLQLWRVPGRHVPGAIARMAGHRPRLARTEGLTFAKLLGTGHGHTFSPRDADPSRWGLLACWADRAHAAAFEDSPVVRSWRRIAAEEWRVELIPLAARGRWSGRTPFGSAPGHGSAGVGAAPGHGSARSGTGAGHGSAGFGAAPGGDWAGPVAAITRARLSPRRARTFWRAVPPVAAGLRSAEGLLAAVGVGEAPIGLQGTFSVWRSAGDLAAFAYRGRAHAEAIRRTRAERWYAEELFARFAVLASAGTYGGKDPVGMTGAFS
jgi:hypothetical protein